MSGFDSTNSVRNFCVTISTQDFILLSHLIYHIIKKPTLPMIKIIMFISSSEILLPLMFPHANSTTE